MAQETKAEGEALRQQAEAAEKLQPLRDEEAARAAVLHRLSVERDALEREEARAKTRQAELETRLAQASRDLAREEEHIAEAEGILRGLGEEARRLEAASSRDHEEPRLREAVMRAAETLAAAELALSEATTALVESRGEGNRLDGEKTRIAERLARSEVEVREIEDELARLEAESGTASMLAGLNAELMLAQVTRRGERWPQRPSRTLRVRWNRGARRSLGRRLDREAATELTILKLLAPGTSAWTPIIDEIKVVQATSGRSVPPWAMTLTLRAMRRHLPDGGSRPTL
jgi:chromosome segregation protein